MNPERMQVRDSFQPWLLGPDTGNKWSGSPWVGQDSTDVEVNEVDPRRVNT